MNGDTLTCSGQEIRPFGIDAPGLHETRCRTGYTGSACDPASLRSGRPAADRLFDLTRNRVRCVKQDEDGYRRVVARRSGPGTPYLAGRWSATGWLGATAATAVEAMR